ncbi:hypothetical protein [Methanosphaera sp.]|uniref:hypothetical protein n=1 Tax=Methanosphaera sp. TaxID=2666342 RepID=UPI002600BF8A|nr:hypothetical protein [Methanosphaera sp.]
MVSTEWKSPNNITQDSRYKIVNGGTANRFTNINAMKKQNTNDYSYCINNNGTSDYRASPVLYFNNFQFNIPSNATITKIHVQLVVQEQTLTAGLKTKVLKLKTGASTTDWGVGNNKASSDRWAVRPTWTTQTYSFTPSEWGLTLLPSTINSSNFGCVFQCVGLSNGHKGYGYWSLPRVAYVRMKIDYNLPVTQNITVKPNFLVEATASKSELDINNSNDVLNVNVKYTHLLSSNNQYVGGNTPTVILSSKNLKIGSNKASSYTCPVLNMPDELSGSTRTTSIPIYPGVQPGRQEIKVTTGNTVINIPITVINSQDSLIEFTDFTKYDKANQKVLVNNCKFKGCTSKTGGAMYIKTKFFFKQKNTYVDNTATSCPNIWHNTECKDS